MSTTRNDESLHKVGESAYASILEMVEALNCDYDRLEELREARDTWERPDGYACESWEEDSETDYDDIKELKALEAAAGECADQDEARQRIEEDALSVEVGGWWTPGSEAEPTEYRILLSTGGPATRIVGELNGFNEPGSARLEVQDWFTPWTEHASAEEDILLAYASCFYFGE